MTTGGELIGQILAAHGVQTIFYLCGGHIAPIAVGCKKANIRVIDVRNEASAVFAADALARLTGVIGAALVTAGPGVTNTLTAIKNAQLAQSPLILLGGSTATLLKGRGSLQDIDQISVVKSAVKWAGVLKTVGEIPAVFNRAIQIAQSGTPGPVFIECPVDLLYPEKLVREWYAVKTDKPAKTIADRFLKWYILRHLNKLFASANVAPAPPYPIQTPVSTNAEINRALAAIQKAERPVFILGSQSVLNPALCAELSRLIVQTQIPVYLSGMARGLLPTEHSALFRHKRKEALRQADLVLLAGVPNDFRLDYGSQISSKSVLISVNRNKKDLYLNRKPTLPILADPATFLIELSKQIVKQAPPRTAWTQKLQANEAARETEIAEQSQDPGSKENGINPLYLFQKLKTFLEEKSVIVADGGDFVATASYILRPQKPLNWLDPGVYGTLGVGGGFAVGAKIARPDHDVWIIYGDGSSAYSLAEFDTCARHGLPVIAVIGNDGCWAQIARDQYDILGDLVGCQLVRSPYHLVAEGYGGVGFLLDDPAQIDAVLAQAKQTARDGKPVLINVHIAKSEFRKGSLSM